MNAKQSACPVCGGNGFIGVVPAPRRIRKRVRAAATADIAPPFRQLGDVYTDAAMMIVAAFRETFDGVSEAALPEAGRSNLRHEVGRVFEDARLAWDRLNPEPPLSEFNNIACELGYFRDFQIGDTGESISTVVCRCMRDQFTERRAAGLLASVEGRVRVCRILATLAGSLQTIGVNNTRPLWEMADTLGGAR